jgi:hypothetical protein
MKEKNYGRSGSRESLVDLTTVSHIPHEHIACLFERDCIHMILRMKKDGGQPPEVIKGEKKYNKITNKRFFSIEENEKTNHLCLATAPFYGGRKKRTQPALCGLCSISHPIIPALFNLISRKAYTRSRAVFSLHVLPLPLLSGSV